MNEEINETQILQELQEFLDKSSRKYSAEIKRQVSDLQAFNGNFWTEDLRKKYKRTNKKKMCLHFSDWSVLSNAIVSPYSSSPWHINVDEEDIQEGVNTFEDENDNKYSLKEGLRRASICGAGFEVITTDADTLSGEPKIVLEFVQNQESVALDPSIQRADCSDAEEGAIVNYISIAKAKWIMPIDDDEYLDFSSEFNSVYDAIIYYENKFPHMNMLSVRWKHLFPKKFHTERTGKVLDYCTEENQKLAESFMHLGDRTVKTIVKNYGLIHYEETKENPAGGHVPKNSTFLGALLFNGENVQGCGTNKIPTDTKDEKIRLIHCRYKGYSEYLNKMKVCKTISDEKHKEKHWNFDFILDYLP